MTSIIIFEGIQTAGKSFLQELVAKKLREKKKTTELVSDTEVNTPFARKGDTSDKTPATDAPQYLKELLQQKITKNKNYILFHNLHLFYLTTNNSRGAKESLHNQYDEIETILEVHPSLIVYLEIEGRYLLPSFYKRFARYKAQGKVDPFKSFLEAKGTEFQQIAYYQKKQNLYKEYLKQTKVHSLHLMVKMNTDYETLADQVVQKIREIEGGFNLN